MRPDLLNLLGALRDQPDDEVAYLALADWCLEQPDPATQARGEHVRLSLGLSRLPRWANGAGNRRERVNARADVRPLWGQVRELERRHRGAWLGSLRDMAHRCDFLAGGLLKFEVTGGRLIQAGNRMVGAPAEEEFFWVSHFVARAVRLEDLGWLAARLPAGCVRSFDLGLSGGPGPGLVDVLDRCRWLEGVRALDVHSGSQHRRDVDAARLAAMPCLGSLRELRLGNAAVGKDGCRAIGESPSLRGLRGLQFRNCGLGVDHLRALLVPAFTPPLLALSLERNNLTPAAAGALAGWPGLASVRKLTLDHNPLGDDGLRALAGSPYLGELRELSLQACDLSSRGLTALDRALGRLEALNVQGNDRIAAATWAALQARFGA